MVRYFIAAAALVSSLMSSNLAWAVRYRIDPQPRSAPPEAYITQPFTALALPERSQLLTLVNFIVDSQPDATEGVDFPRYDRRQQFGTWILSTPETDCYNTRAKILIRDSQVAVTFADKNPCRVVKGQWHDLYTGKDLVEATEVQIDHVVPLKNAYISGAWKWDKQKRCHYANFINYDSHLLPVSGNENMKKGDSTPAEYMPPDDKFACAYLQRWLNVKAVWDLSLEEDEVDQIRQLIANHRCSVKYQTVNEDLLQNLREHMTEIETHCTQ